MVTGMKSSQQNTSGMLLICVYFLGIMLNTFGAESVIKGSRNHINHPFYVRPA